MIKFSENVQNGTVARIFIDILGHCLDPEIAYFCFFIVLSVSY